MSYRPIPNKYNGRAAAVVATHKDCRPLEKCLQGLIALLHSSEDLIFVDNGSQENLDSWAEANFPGITTMRLPENRFFCGGYNAGIKLAAERGYEFVLIVNADTQVANKDFLATLLGVARRWPRAAFIGPLVYYRSPHQHQKTCLEFPSIFRNLLIWLPWRFAQRALTRQFLRERQVQFLNGVCVLCRMSALRDIGLMDETFGGYVEDADWSYRALKRGWVSVFSPVPSVTHYEETIGYEPYSTKTFMLKRNTVLWFLKAGFKRSAMLYAFASIALARARMIVEPSPVEKENHRRFCRQLQRAYWGLLRGDDLDEWFGPPVARREGCCGE